MDVWTSGLFFGAMVDEELDADLLKDLEGDEGLEEDLGEFDEELEKDLNEEHEADEDETSACAPLPGAPDVMSWIRDTGSKGYPLFRFGMGREEG